MAWKKIMHYKVGYLILMVIIVTLAYFPVAAPIAPTEVTQKAYDLIETLGPEDRILWLSGLSGGWYKEYLICQRAVFKHILSREIPVVVISRNGDAVPNDLSELADYYAEPGQTVYDSPDYGTKIAYLGYYTTDGILQYTLADNFRLITSTDAQGTSFDDLPILEDVYDAGDFDMIMYTSPIDRAAPSAILIPYGVKLVCIESAGGFGWMIDLYSAGLVESILPGARGAAEYEALINEPGEGHRYASIILGITIFAVIGIVGGNIAHVLQRKEVT
jgi:hypothetical protein